MIGHLKYRSDLFEKSSISNFILNWQAFIDQAVRNPNLPVAAVPLVFEPQPDPEPFAGDSPRKSDGATGEPIGR